MQINRINPSNNLAFNSNILSKVIINRKNISTTLPIVTTPLLAYFGPKKDKNIRDEHIKAEADNFSNHPVTDRTKFNTKALKKAGYKDSEINRELDKEGYIKNQSTKTELKKQNITFKSSPDEEIPQDDYSEITNPELKTYLQQFDEMDTDLPPDLQEIYNAPPIEAPEGIIGSILGDDFLENNNIDLHWDFLSTLKKMAADILDFGD